ncbi:MAG: flavin reductase [Clostridiales bacterium]|nr:flavin reductase [Clostridiales bacterium]
MQQITTKISYGVYVVTTWTEGKPTGCIANSIMQVTSKPATFAVSINHDNFTNECIKKTGKFAISVLAEDSDPAIIGTFGFKSGRDTDKFANVGYAVESRLPVLDDSCGYIVCDVIDTMETSTHTVFLGEVKASEQYGDRKQMTYDYYHKVIKGKSPKTAPTYVEAQESAQGASEAKPKRKYVCEICGYVYEGDELPDDITCPICGVGKDQFKEI